MVEEVDPLIGSSYLAHGRMMDGHETLECGEVLPGAGDSKTYITGMRATRDQDGGGEIGEPMKTTCAPLVQPRGPRAP